MTRLSQSVSGISNGSSIATQYGYTNDRLTGITHNGFTYNIEYDIWGSQTAIKLGSQTLVSYEYDAVYHSRLNTITYANGDTVHFTYDTKGTVTSTTKNGAELSAYEYAYSDGNLSRVTDNESGLTTVYTDDAVKIYSGETLVYSSVSSVNANENMVITESFAGKTYTLTQNDEVFDIQTGKTTSTSTLTGYGGKDIKMSSASDYFGRKTQEDIAWILEEEQGYTVGLDLREIYGYKTLDGASNTYGKDNLITRHDMNTLRRHTYTYDTLNRLTNVTMNSTTPVSLDYTYALSERNTGGGTLYTTSKLKTEVISDTAYLYTYDNTGNILTISETTRANKDNESAYVLKQSYEYDNLDRLIRENDVNIGRTILYSYDAGGNFTEWKTYPYTTEPISLLGEPEYIHEFTYDNVWKDKLTSVKVIAGDDFFTDSITYDEIGNPTLFLSKDMTWSGRELTSHDGVTYKYNADGLRTSKKLEDGKKIEYYYSGTKLVFEHREINYEGSPDGLSMFYTYDDGGNISNIRYIIDSIGYQHNYYPVCNSRGDVVEIYDYYGNLMANILWHMGINLIPTSV